MTNLEVSHFTSISGHFSSNYISILYKTEVLTVLWRSQHVKILIGLKATTKITIFLFPFIFNFLRKKSGNLQLINGHFTTIYGRFSANYNKIFHKTEAQTVILRCLVYLYLDWIKSYDIILVKNFFFMPENALFQGYFAEVSFGIS